MLTPSNEIYIVFALIYNLVRRNFSVVFCGSGNTYSLANKVANARCANPHLFVFGVGGTFGFG